MKSYLIRLATTHPSRNFDVTEHEITVTAESPDAAHRIAESQCKAWQTALRSGIREVSCGIASPAPYPADSVNLTGDTHGHITGSVNGPAILHADGSVSMGPHVTRKLSK